MARLERAGFRLRTLDGMPSFFVVEDGPYPLSLTLEHWAGLFYVQQASTGLAAPALGARPGERVLDLCSSPGGKLTHLAELMGDSGSLVACDVDEKRIRGLLGNVYRLCVPNVLVVAGDGRAFPEGALFDRVLVDAPCSGEGTIRRRSGDAQDHSKKFRASVAHTQRALLEKAIRLTRPGGTLLYVTCTFAPEENEAVVSAVLERLPVEIEPLDLAVPHARGLTSFEGAVYHPSMVGAARIYPHHLDSGGLFMAKLRRLEGDAPVVGRDAGWSPMSRAFPDDGRTEDEADRLVSDAVATVLSRHGIAPETFEGYDWTVRADTLWLHSRGEWPLPAWEPGRWRAISVGLRAIELDTSGRPRATNDLLRFASAAVRSAVVDVTEERLLRLLSGEAEPVDEATPYGPTALRLDGEVVGRGACKVAGLFSEVPKSRAVDLTRALTRSENV
ncbi:MAG: RNA methyltransferase [Gemmatimonadetes bacterium]|nr:RNA methyltransferase [Gemmatimonadota bacterium]